jgi:hypothetical protein
MAAEEKGGKAHDHHDYDYGAHVPPGLRQQLIPEWAGASLESAFTVMYQNLTMRPICGREELELFCRLPYELNEEIADDLDAGRRRPEWMWVALDGDRVLARTAWWGQAQDVPRIRASTDLDNLPMARAFERARWVNFERTINMTWQPFVEG